MKVLIITRHYLHETNGGAFASRAFIDAISSLYSNSTLIYPQKYDTDDEIFVMESIKRIPCLDRRLKIQKGVDVYRGILHRFKKFVTSHLVDNVYDIIFLDHSLVANGILNFIRNLNVKIITIHHNVERRYLEDNKPNILIRIPTIYFAEKAEKEAINLSDLNLTISLQDAKYFRNNISKSDKNNIFYWGNFEYLGQPRVYERLDFKKEEDLVLVISGSLNFKQTESAIIDFLRNYYTIVKGRYTKCKLLIAGQNPSKKIKRICESDKTIKLFENPKDIYHIIRLGKIYVSPISGGSGVKLRMMDGFKLGLPVISHENSAKGYEKMLEEGCMYTYKTPEEFIESIEKVLNSKLDSQYIYSKYYRRFSFEAGKERLKQILLENNLLTTK